MKVGVVGAAGRMGATVCRAVGGDPDMDLVVGVDPSRAGDSLVSVTGAGPQGAIIAADLDALVAAGADVVIDFTSPSVIRSNLAWYAAYGLHAVVGTTGLSDEDVASVAAEFDPGRGAGCIIAPNFAIGAVLMIRFAEMAAPWFETAEIIELHHDAKVDAPSGTAMLTASRMAEASSEWGSDPTRSHVVDGARGGVGPGGIHVHAVRLKGLVAHQQVLMGTTGQTLSIRHDSIDREAFMPGVLIAVRAVADRPGLTVGLDAVLGI
ncbi:MAG: 4-hydroxy-tetrahydrodipicolinate reductase [Actinomycetota bacterium]|nr:4-hydroxy-tetrahydrodipicolinate reductase [Actinomycetota bacterium]